MVISKGYNKMVIQTGRGTYTPAEVNDAQFQSEVYKESLKTDMEDSSLIISHGGRYIRGLVLTEYRLWESL